MHPDPNSSSGSTKGSDAHRRERAVHKIRLSELAGVSGEDVAAMVASGDIELLVRRSDIADGSNGGWSHRLSDLFDKVAAGLEGAPQHENRTIIVNIVAAKSGAR